MSSFVIRHEWCGGGDNNSIMNRYYWYGMVWYGMVWYGGVMGVVECTRIVVVKKKMIE